MEGEKKSCVYLYSCPFLSFSDCRDLSNNRISSLEDGVFDNLFNLTEM